MSHSQGCESYEWIQTCRSCGAEYDLSNFSFVSPLTCLMHQDNLCPECAFWKDLFVRFKNRIEVVDGYVYTYGERMFIYQENDKRPQTFYLKKFDGSMVRMVYSYCYGKMPGHIRKEHPDTGRFIKGEAFRKIQRHTGQLCKARGCYDRYHCLWYDLSTEKDGPWNEIPESHNPGDEHCMSYIDKTDMFNVEINHDNRSRF